MDSSMDVMDLTPDEKLVWQSNAYTYLGSQFNRQPSSLCQFNGNLELMDQRYAKLIYAGQMLGVIDECIIIASCLDNDQYFFRYPKLCNLALLRHYEEWMKLDNGVLSDHILLLKAFTTLENYNTIEMGMTRNEWIYKIGVNKDTYRDAIRKKNAIRRRLGLTANQQQQHSIDQEHKWILIKCAITIAFLPLGFTSMYGIGDNKSPELYKWTSMARGVRAKSFYDLTRTLTYINLPFTTWEEDGYHLNNEDDIQRQVENYFELNGNRPEAVDLVVRERKLNVVFSSRGPRFLNFVWPIYQQHRKMQLKQGNIPIEGEEIGYTGRYMEMDPAVGPHNPLELKFRSLLANPVFSKVRVDGSSVCSAVFDPNFHHNTELNKSRRFLLIGTNITIQDPATIVTRTSTLFHEKEGQLEVMLIMFGPRIVLFSDMPVSLATIIKNFRTLHNLKRMKDVNFQNLRIGLTGFKVSSGTTTEFGDTDMLVSCQFELSYDDIMKVAKARRLLRQLLLEEIQQSVVGEIQEIIFSLLNRQRDRIISPINSMDLIFPPNASQLDTIGLPDLYQE